MVGLDQYGAEPFEQQQLGTAGVERVNTFAAVQTMVFLSGNLRGLLRVSNADRICFLWQLRSESNFDLMLAQFSSTRYNIILFCTLLSVCCL